MKKIAVLIDGGHLRVAARHDGYTYDSDFIVEFSKSLPCEDEELLRVLYYDCDPFRGETKLPVSKKPHEFTGSGEWLSDLASRDLMAVRRGVLKFRGWSAKGNLPTGQAVTDEDFQPLFEQKGVDLRIGLDIANFAHQKNVDRVVLVSADTDLIPALKLARRAGLQTIGIQLPGRTIGREMRSHFDAVHVVTWPAGAKRRA